MSELDVNFSSEFIGEFRYRVDESRRAMVPAEWRVPEAGQRLTIMPWPVGVGKYLLVLPPARWKALLERLNALSLSNEEVAAVERVIGGSSAHVVLDGAGRLCLPEKMTQALGIKKEVVFVGRLHKFEIWNPEQYELNRGGDLQVAAAKIGSLIL